MVPIDDGGAVGAPPSPGRNRAGKVLWIIGALERTYGRPTAGERKDPLSELIFTILSQNTNDVNRDRAWVSLWKSFPSWRAIASAARHRVEAAIRVGGLAPTKSRVIQETLRKVKEDQRGYSLEALAGMDMREVEEYLAGFKGVGLKTIRCVQVFSLGQPAFPVDTHIFRITKRLGLVPPKASHEVAHRIMGALTPASEVLPFHINLITHGRRVCKAARPLCGECVIRRRCNYYRERPRHSR
ncbi:MAG TPA: endonuclease III [Candidatus Polarisedimenticolia bacterium]|jgi:endonuclease-3